MAPKIRISKLLTDLNICSRKKAEEWVDKKWIKVNASILEKPEHKIETDDFILLDSKAFDELQDQFTIIINKPVGFVSSFDDPKYKHALSLVNKKNFYGTSLASSDIEIKDLGVVGRLDADSRGLLLFTTDGSFAKSIIGPMSHVEKEYLVKVNGKINEQKIKKLCFGLSLDGKKLKRAKVKQIKKDTLNFILTEGKKRQIRRMCQMLDLHVVDLLRIRIGDIKLDKNLSEGQWTFLA